MAARFALLCIQGLRATGRGAHRPTEGLKLGVVEAVLTFLDAPTLFAHLSISLQEEMGNQPFSPFPTWGKGQRLRHVCLQHPGCAQQMFAEGRGGVSSQYYILSSQGGRQRKRTDSSMEWYILPPQVHDWGQPKILHPCQPRPGAICKPVSEEEKKSSDLAGESQWLWAGTPATLGTLWASSAMRSAPAPA